MIAQSDVSTAVEEFMRGLVRRNPGEQEFHQAVRHLHRREGHRAGRPSRHHVRFGRRRARPRRDVDYARGANLAGFKRVADAMLAYGIV